MQRLIWMGLVAAGLLVLSAFTPTALIPPSAEPAARKVFVIDHGTHSSLALETESGEMIRYAYGDLRYYATRDTSLGSGVAALLIPTPATLGRGELSAPATAASVQQQSRVVVEIIYELEVREDLADALMIELDGIFFRGQAEHIAVPAYGLVFAPHPEDYFWANNSSTVIARWLGQMDVGVFGWGLIASWRVAGP